ncbi:MAG TPA: T9SS type A sorting domain-containing protein, partial [Bacteroidia bacterium]|nr:T9SS type A sorting domain-containing protein [Bacteroidia bacterium]
RIADQTQYTLLDDAPLTGYSWYRLAYKDVSGAVTHAPARQVWIEDSKPRLSIFPNPAQDWLRVQLPQADGEGILQVVNAQGTVVMATSVNGFALAQGMRLDVSTLESGIYSLRVLGMGGDVVKFCRVKGD